MPINNFKGKNVLSIEQFDKRSLQKLFKAVPRYRKIAIQSKPSKDLSGKVVALLFFEPSSRTFSSFSSAIKRLGGQTIEFQDLTRNSSVKKGESFEDTIRTFATYSNAIVIRHPTPFSAEIASKNCDIPIINAGDGAHEHPTQTLLDLYTIYEKFKRLDNLTGVLVGDLLYGRTVHSLLKALSLFKNNTLYLLSPKRLKFPLSEIDKKFIRNLKIVEIEHEKQIPKNANFWYWTRVQKERFKNLKEYDRLKGSFVLTKKLLQEKGNKNLILMHPLPRVGEIEEEVDEDSRAYYFRNQIQNGLYVRMALLSLMLK